MSYTGKSSSATDVLKGDLSFGAGGGGSGTVTSVDLSVPSVLSVTGNPVTTSGTLAVDLATQVANKVFVGPASGADAKPTFRVLEAADLNNHGLYSIAFGTTAVHNPADTTVYYFGRPGLAVSTTADTRRVYVPLGGTLIAAHVSMHAGTAVGTNENVTMDVRINNTTDVSIATVGAATAYRNFANTGLSTAVVAGDYFEIKVTPPAWVTNPTGVIYWGHLIIAA